MKITCRCPHCDILNEVDATTASCSSCSKNLLPHPTDAFTKSRELNQCPVCGAAHVYQQKDFNRVLGVGLLVVGVVLSFYTYGISLLVVTAIDFLLYKFVGDVGVCYRCKSAFRDDPAIKRLEGFNLPLHDYYRSAGECENPRPPNPNLPNPN